MGHYVHEFKKIRTQTERNETERNETERNEMERNETRGRGCNLVVSAVSDALICGFSCF